ncbi:VOC family protein [Sulfurimonas sp.]|uniref:VOC family protein n=1 Tax=Sulfurimonas sp. TaxID=2022749 RepID=UPI0025F87EAC|nr:VOC family protein [Sulfurimonas sp.]
MFKLRHIGIVVRNLKDSVAFYKDLFDLEVQKEMIEEGKYIDELVAIKDASISWTKLKAKDGTVLELLEYQNTIKQEKNNYAANRLGCSHIAVSVKNIDEIYEKLQKYNCKCNSKPLFSPDGNVKVMYGHDIDGTILEVVEELK